MAAESMALGVLAYKQQSIHMLAGWNIWAAGGAVRIILRCACVYARLAHTHCAWKRALSFGA